MLPRLRLRNTRRRLIRNSKGFSSIVGAVFAALVMISLISTVFVWSLSQNTLYNNAVRESSQADLDRKAENIKVWDTTYSANAINSARVMAELQNLGPLPVQFITIWIYMSNETWHNYNYDKLDTAIQGGANRTLNIYLAVSGVYPTSNYSFSSWLITTRGNTIALQEAPLEEDQEILVSMTTQGIGYVMMNFDNFVYYNVTGKTLEPFPDGGSGYSVYSKFQGLLAFRVNVTNLDYKQKRDIILTSDSVFFSIFPTTPQQVRGSYWYIVNVNGQTISDTYTPITLPYNMSTAIYFASDHAIKPGYPFAGAYTNFRGTAPINLALVGTLGGDPFGQNIPFVSIIFQPA